MIVNDTVAAVIDSVVFLMSNGYTAIIKHRKEKSLTMKKTIASLALIAALLTDHTAILAWLLNEAPKRAAIDPSWAALLTPQNAPPSCSVSASTIEDN